MIRYGSRKFLLTLGVIAFACLTFWAGKLTEGAFVDLVKWALGLYGTANVGAMAANKLGIAIGAAK